MSDLTLEEKVNSLSIPAKTRLIRKVYADDFLRFLEDVVWTIDESDMSQSVKRFPYDWLYLQELAKALLTYKYLFVWKSRQVLCSWLLCAYALWVVLFHQGKKVAIQSKKSDDADALIRRMEFMYNRLPSWKPKAEFPYCRVKVAENVSDVYGIPQGPEQLRSFTFSVIISDEIGFQEQANEAFSASRPCIDGGGSYIAVTTPPKEKNFAFQCLKNPLFQEPSGKLVRLHYSRRPDRTKEWADKAKIGWDQQAWDRENELTFVEAGQLRVYDTFLEVAHVNPNLIYNPHLTLYRSFDFGYTRPACLFSQVDNDDRWLDLFEVLGKSQTIESFASVIIRETAIRFPEAKTVNFCDIAGTQKSDKGEKTSIQLLQEALGQSIQYRKFEIEVGHIQIRKQMEKMIRGKPGYQIHPVCSNSIDGFLYGYRYKPNQKDVIGKGINEAGEEEVDYFKHLQDCRRYSFGNVYNVTGSRMSENQKLSALRGRS